MRHAKTGESGRHSTLTICPTLLTNIITSSWRHSVAAVNSRMSQNPKMPSIILPKNGPMAVVAGLSGSSQTLLLLRSCFFSPRFLCLLHSLSTARVPGWCAGRGVFMSSCSTMKALPTARRTLDIRVDADIVASDVVADRVGSGLAVDLSTSGAASAIGLCYD